MEINTVLNATSRTLHTILPLILLLVFFHLINGMSSLSQECTTDQSQIFKKKVELKTQTTTSLEIQLIQKLEFNGGQTRRNTKTEYSSSRLLTLLLFLYRLLTNLVKFHQSRFRNLNQSHQEHQVHPKSHSVAQAKAIPPQQSPLI